MAKYNGKDLDVVLFLTDGFEETEALTTVDILRRANIKTVMASITKNEYVKSKNGIITKADALFEEIEDISETKMIVLPGGAVTEGYHAHGELLALIKHFDRHSKLIAAICAAPTVLGKLGILKGRKATCFPSMEDGLIGADVSMERVCVDKNIITSRAAGTTMYFALEIVRVLAGEEEMQRVKSAMVIA